MLDFSKWADMWNAYNRMGEAVSGSPASICQDIGLTLMMVFGFVGLIAVAVIGGEGDDPEESPFFCLTMTIAVIGGVPDAGTYRCTITDSKDDSTVRDVRLVVMADNKVGLYDADGKALK